MPANLAHFAIAKDVSWRFKNRNRRGKSFFEGRSTERYENISKYIYLGSIGPDIPLYYDADLEGTFNGTTGLSEPSDLFHYNKQSEFILNLVKVIKETNDQARRNRTMAYALGHTIHLIADSIIHPYINYFAGAYNCQVIEKLHRTVELHQDSWLARRYFRRDQIDEGESWINYMPDCFQVGWPLAITYVNEETEEVFEDIITAFRTTYGHEMDLEYIKDSYENFYDIVLDIGYDTPIGPMPTEPHESLVKHERLRNQVEYYPDLLRNKAVSEAMRACEAVIALFDSNLSESDQNTFRSKVKNINMDTGYWIDVRLEDNKLKIIWKHVWCDTLR